MYNDAASQGENMSEINNLNNYNTAFNGVNNKEMQKRKLNTAELTAKCTAMLKEDAERRMPENGRFRKFCAAFDIPETRFEAWISASNDEIQPKDMRRIAVEVHHQNSDKFYSQYIYKGAKQEILKFLDDEKSQKIILDAVIQLQKRAEEDY